MPIQISPVIRARSLGDASAFSVQSLEIGQLGERASPVVVLDDFRVNGRPFGPHPHAGFSAVTYVFEDSKGGLRSRDSLGNDVVTGPGGIVWTQAGRGVIHEEVPAEASRELHGLQVFVNLSARNKLAAPQMLRLDKGEVPEWRNDAGDRVRVAVGSFDGVSSPLAPVEPFTFLDVTLRREISFEVPPAHSAIVYTVGGDALVRVDGREQKVTEGHAVALYGDSARVAFAASRPAHIIVLSGATIREPVLVQGSFIMNERSQIEAAVAHFRAGQMGHLAPLADG